MAATNRPLIFSKRIQLPLSPEDLRKLDELAAAREKARTETVRELISEEHAYWSAAMKQAEGGTSAEN